MRRFVFFTAVMFCMAIMPASVFGQDLEGSMSAYRVTLNKQGEELFEKVDNAAPGELIEYRIFYQNKGETVVSNLKVDGPVPANTQYVAGSADGNVPYALLVSIDHGNTWEPEPVKRMKRMPDGTEQEVIIPVAEYTQIRWVSQKPFGPNEEQKFDYRVELK